VSTIEQVMTGARTHLRDQPRFFTAAVARAGLSGTFKLPHPNVRQFGMFVAATDGTSNAIGVHVGPGVTASPTQFTYVLDESEGLLRIVEPRTGGFGDQWQFNIEGYYYTWISETDMRYFANKLFAEHAHNRNGFVIDNISDVEEDVMALGTAVECLFSLLTEFSLDIDINTPEGIPVQATQRFHQVQSMLFGKGGVGDRYSQKSSMLGVGLDRVEMLTLRRVEPVRAAVRAT